MSGPLRIATFHARMGSRLRTIEWLAVADRVTSQTRAKRLCVPGAMPHRWWPMGRAGAICLRCSAAA